MASVNGLKTNHAIPFSGNGKALTDLLIEAAGLKGKRVVALSCHIKSKELITFDATLQGQDDAIGEALKHSTLDVSTVQHPIAEHQPCP